MSTWDSLDEEDRMVADQRAARPSKIDVIDDEDDWAGWLDSPEADAALGQHR